MVGPIVRLPVVLEGEVEEEGRRVLHHRVAAGAEELGVARVVVVVPQVQRHPRPAERPQPAQRVVERRGVGPQVGVVVGDEPAAVVVDAGGVGAVDAHPVEEVEERLVTLRQRADLHRPVVHLGIDVDRELAVPPRDVHLVPDPLEVGRQRPRSARPEQQVAAELEELGEQIGVVAAGPDPLQSSVGRQQGRLVLGRRAPERDADPAHLVAVLVHVVGADESKPRSTAASIVWRTAAAWSS